MEFSFMEKNYGIMKTILCLFSFSHVMNKINDYFYYYVYVFSPTQFNYLFFFLIAYAN